MSAAPLKPITGGQIKALHAIARRRGMSHDDLREAAGVDSLKELSVAQASTLIDRLQASDRRGEFEPAAAARAHVRGAIRLASERQRNYIAVLFDEMGWSDAKAREWLKREHGIKDLANGIFSTKAASQAIRQLEQIGLRVSRQEPPSKPV